MLRCSFATTLAFLSLATVANAAFITPGFRGGADTTYQAWDVFSLSTGPNVPDVANSNPNGNANAFDASNVSFVTSGGNIYGLNGVMSFEATVPDYGYGPASTSTVVVQVRTLGSEIDVDSFLWNGIAFTTSDLLFEQSLGGAPGSPGSGVIQEWVFTWEGLVGNPAINTLTFSSQESSLSFDKLSIDTHATAVPELGSTMLVGCGMGIALVAAGLRRRTTQG